MRQRVGAVEIAYDLTGPDAAPVVVLGHCFAAHRGLWQAQLEALADYRVLRYDTRGHGESSTPPGPYTFDALAGDVIGLLDALRIEQVHYCGISMSGMVGQTLGIRHGERLRSLILVNTTSAYDPAQRDAWDARIAEVRRNGVGGLHDALMARWFTESSRTRRIPGVQLMSESCRAFSPAAFIASASMLRDLDLTAQLARIACPTCVIAGAEDPATPPAMAELITAHVPDATLAVIDEAAHISPAEQPAVFNAILRAFLDAQAQR